MKAASPALIAMLNGATQFYMVDLYTLTLLDGSTFRYSGMDVDLVVGGNTFVAGGLKFERAKTRLTTGLEVDTLDMTVFADASAMLGGQAFLAFARKGGLDGAAVQVDRLFMTTFGDTSAGTVIMFVGRISDIEVARGHLQLTVKSYLELLDAQMPRNLIQAGCLHTLYDNGCGLSRASYTVGSSATAGCTTTLVNCGLAQASGYFDLGSVTFTGGANSGLIRTVKTYTPGALTLSYPLPSAPANGDTFTAVPGCDKAQNTCTAKFSNLANFRGFPYVPVPETAR